MCVTSLAQRCQRRRSSARPLGPDHSVATSSRVLEVPYLLSWPLGLKPLGLENRGGSCMRDRATVTDDRHRRARTLVRWTTRSRSCCVALVGLHLCHLYSPQNLVCLTLSRRPLLGRSVSSDTGSTSPELSGFLRSACLTSSHFQSDPAPYQRRNSRTSVHPRREGYLRKASPRLGAQRSLEVKKGTLVLLTARFVAARPEHV